MEIDLRPPIEAAGIHLGVTRTEARRQCLALGEPSEVQRTQDRYPSLVVHRRSGLTSVVHFDDKDLVEAIEFGRPEHGGDVVSHRGMDIFGTPADELVARLRENKSVKVTEHGCSFTVPDLLLALWRPVVPEHHDDEDGRYFEAVLIARPGYHD